jgi:hypothetical protein
VGFAPALDPILRGFPIDRPQGDDFVLSGCGGSKGRLDEIDRLPDLEPVDLICHREFASGGMLACRTGRPPDAAPRMGLLGCMHHRFIKAESFKRGQ